MGVSGCRFGYNRKRRRTSRCYSGRRVAGFRNQGRFWIGASNLYKTDLEWVDGQKVSFNPNELGTLEADHCVENFAPRKNQPPDVLALLGKWTSLPFFENRLGYMCEK